MRIGSIENVKFAAFLYAELQIFQVFELPFWISDFHYLLEII